MEKHEDNLPEPGKLKLTVVQTLPALEVGGVERGTLDVAAELVRRGHRSIVISNEGRMVKELVSAGSEFIHLPIGKKTPLTFRHLFKLKNILADTRADILHTRSRLPAWISYLAWYSLPEKHRPAFITSVHGPYTVNWYSKIMTRGERVIAISDFIKDYIVKNYPDVNQDKIVIIPRGINPDIYNSTYTPSPGWLRQWQHEHPYLKDSLVMTLPARITRWKGQADFVNIIHQLKSSGLLVHGFIAGAAEKRRQNFYKELQNQVAELGLARQITFLGQRDDLIDILSISDLVFSLANEPEAFGRTALEALALGTPVIAYDHGGASQVLKELFPCGLVTPGDAKAAADKALALLGSGKTIISKNPFTLQSMLDKTISVYEELALNNSYT